MLKREERAAASAKLKEAALKKAFKKKKPSPAKPVVIALTKQPVRNPKFDAWMKTSLATSAVENSKKSKVIANIVVPVVSSNNCEETLKKEASSVVGVKSACEFEKQAMAGSSVPLVPSVAIVEALPTPIVEVTQPKKVLSFVQLQLETKLNQMRERGFEKEDFMRLLRKFDLNDVLGLVAGENDFDQRNLRKSLAGVAYRM